jgi:hypothetical protein
MSADQRRRRYTIEIRRFERCPCLLPLADRHTQSTPAAFFTLWAHIQKISHCCSFLPANLISCKELCRLPWMPTEVEYNKLVLS